jgi:hypothetical protein
MGDLAFLFVGKEVLKMNYRKTFKRITLIAWSTIAVIFVMWSIILHPAEANSLFYPAVSYSAGDTPYYVAIGNFDGDNDQDLAVANYWSDNVSVLLGNGDGTFQPAVNYGAGVSPSSVAIGNLNGDDDPDLAVAALPSNVSVLLGNGDGTFQHGELRHRWHCFLCCHRQLKWR